MTAFDELPQLPVFCCYHHATTRSVRQEAAIVPGTREVGSVTSAVDAMRRPCADARLDCEGFPLELCWAQVKLRRCRVLSGYSQHEALVSYVDPFECVENC